MLQGGFGFGLLLPGRIGWTMGGREAVTYYIIIRQEISTGIPALKGRKESYALLSGKKAGFIRR